MSVRRGGGPFRIDAKVERRVACASPEAFLRVREVLAGRVGLGGLGFALCLAVTTLAEALVTLEPLAFVAALLLLSAAVGLHRDEQRARERGAAFRTSAPTHCAFVSEGFILEGPMGTSMWRYPGARSIGVVGDWLVLSLDSGLVVLRNEPGLQAWIMERAPHLAEKPLPSWAGPRRALLVLGIAYPLAVALGLAALGR